MNIKKQYSIREYGLPSVFSGTNILSTTIDGDYWVINGVNTNIKVKQASDPESDPGIVINNANDLAFYNRRTAGTPPTGQDVDNYVFQKNLELLNSRINAIHKELTYWDLYKLTASVENAEDLDAVFSSLSVGQSMVINCPTFTKGGIEYARGDVIVRTAESQEIQIKALSTGLFYPSALTRGGGGNTFVITYTYSQSAPSEDPDSSIEVNVGDDPIKPEILPQTISFKGLQDQAGTIYGLLYTLSNTATGDDVTIGSFDVLYENGVDEHGVPQGSYILPIIKCFDSTYEEISLDRSRVWLTLDDTEDLQQWSVHCNANNVQGILQFVQVK